MYLFFEEIVHCRLEVGTPTLCSRGEGSVVFAYAISWREYIAFK